GAADPGAEAIDHPDVCILPDELPRLDVNLLPGGQLEGCPWTRRLSR
ncbi:MAG: hypothetical protein HGA45_02080, partial [Chloroflexales bacterium]|nr:hypothetical protein [Chloroflexales bacterium]